MVSISSVSNENPFDFPYFDDLYARRKPIVPKIERNNANKYCEAPTEIPIQIENNKNAKLKGSFTAVLNRTTDKAPTNPRDNASDDLTTATNEATLIVIINKVLPNDILDEKVVANFQ